MIRTVRFLFATLLSAVCVSSCVDVESPVLLGTGHGCSYIPIIQYFDRDRVVDTFQ